MHVENASISAYDLLVVVIYSLWRVWDGWGNDHEIAMEKVLFCLFQLSTICLSLVVASTYSLDAG